MSEQTRQNGHDEDLVLRLERIEAKQDQVVIPKVRDEVPELETQIQRLVERVDAQSQRIDELESRLEASTQIGTSRFRWSARLSSLGYSTLSRS